MRQESAEKLASSFCDGTEEFKCKEIRENTDSLCFEKEKDVNNTIGEEEVNESTGVMKKSSLLVVISLICSVLNTSLEMARRRLYSVFFIIWLLVILELSFYF